MSDADYLIKQASKSKVELIQLWYPSVAGQLRGAVVPTNQLEQVLDAGVPMSGNEVGLERGTRFILRPDPSTWATLPWHATNRVARLICDVDDVDGRPAVVDTRSVLKSAMGRAAALDYRLYAGAGLCHYLLDASGEALAGQGGGQPFGLDPASTELAFGADVIGILEDLGAATTGFGTAAGPGQLRVGFAYSDALTLADSLLSARAVASVVAKRQGVLATLMPFPFAGQPRSGMDLTLSLDSDDGDVELHGVGLDEAKSPSSSAQGILAALSQVHGDASLFTRPTINSYTAPVAVDGVCSLTETTGDERPNAFVFRGADAIANPYLVLALLIDATVGRLGQSRAPETSGGEQAPVTLAQAADRARHSVVVRTALGTPLVELAATAAEQDGAAYRRQVTAWERERYLRA